MREVKDEREERGEKDEVNRSKGGEKKQERCKKREIRGKQMEIEKQMDVEFLPSFLLMV